MTMLLMPNIKITITCSSLLSSLLTLQTPRSQTFDFTEKQHFMLCFHPSCYVNCLYFNGNTFI